MEEFRQSQLNVGTLGHVDHGKTTLTKAITGVWTDRHSESIKRSMTIKLGYADATIKKCEKCEGASAYTTGDKCQNCGGKAVPVRRISLLDAPGHETLMATAIAGSNIIDAVLFVIAATEPCPMPQTKEHLMLLNVLNVKHIVIAQTKIDVVGKEKAEVHYKQIKDFVKGSVAENAPIIPVVANKNINIDAILEMIANIPIPDRNVNEEPFMYIVRSFDANKPGTKIEKLIGGIIGGSIVKGKFKVGDEIEIRPGINIQKGKDSAKKDMHVSAKTIIESISTDTGKINEAIAGGLIGLATDLDPSFTKADSLTGNVVGKIGKLPDSVIELHMEYHIFDREGVAKQPIVLKEPLLLGIGTATVVGFVEETKKNRLKVRLRKPVCALKGSKASILRNMQQRWRLAGYGVIE